MSNFENICENDSRRRLFLRSIKNPDNQDSQKVNGIDYLEVKRIYNNNGTSVNEIHSEITMDNLNSVTSSVLLLVFLFKEPMPLQISKDNVAIIGGTRIKNIEVEFAGRLDEIFGDLNNDEKKALSNIEYLKRKKLVVVKPRTKGDPSRYLLKLIKKEDPEEPLADYDPIFYQVEFTFNVGCDNNFDCKVDKICSPITFKEPSLDYMAKDYASFVRLILSRFNQILPLWKEKSAADITNVLIELLAYVGDHLSYYQDSVSTETYLGTARKRISVKRHARLLDYFISEGSNARTWVCFEISKNLSNAFEGINLRKSTKLITGETQGNKLSISKEEFIEIASDNRIVVFETMYDVNLYHAHNEIYFYTWGESDCCLPRGCTSATLLREIEKTGENGETYNVSLDIRIFYWDSIEVDEADQENLRKFIKKISLVFRDIHSINIRKIDSSTVKLTDINDPIRYIIIKLFEMNERAIASDNQGNFVYEFMTRKVDNRTEVCGLSLIPGDVLIFEEVVSPTTLFPSDRDPSHRQAVKLRNIKRTLDPITNAKLIEIFWDDQDALQFPLCIDVSKTDSNNKVIPISIVRGNVTLVDHGNTIINEVMEKVPVTGRYYPRLDKLPLTFQRLFIPSASAYSLIQYNQEVDNSCIPSIHVYEGPEGIIMGRDPYDLDKMAQNSEYSITKWLPSRDLLSSNKFAKQFVVEIDNESNVYLRFGDGINGQMPQKIPEVVNMNDERRFFATYRIGNGSAGNVGYSTINRIVEDKDNIKFIEGITKISNPLPALGGVNPETLDEVRQNAPIAFMRQERAVTEEDYITILKQHPDVQNAVAIFRWTGSWYTVFVTIDRLNGKQVDYDFRQELYLFLNKYRLAGYDIEIKNPNYVPLEINVDVCVKPNHFAEKVKNSLLRVFSTHFLEDGKKGFFHPDNFTFGQPLFLSKIYQTIMNTEGVESAFVTKFHRMRKPNDSDIESGIIATHLTEIILLNNDPNYPDNGRIEFIMKGGI